MWNNQVAFNRLTDFYLWNKFQFWSPICAYLIVANLAIYCHFHILQLLPSDATCMRNWWPGCAIFQRPNQWFLSVVLFGLVASLATGRHYSQICAKQSKHQDQYLQVMSICFSFQRKSHISRPLIGLSKLSSSEKTLPYADKWCQSVWLWSLQPLKWSQQIRSFA